MATVATVWHGVGEARWSVDEQAAAAVMPWVARRPAVWQAELAAMAAHLPTWVLVGGQANRPAACGCGGLLAPTQGALRCVACGRTGRATQLLWVGQLPIPARPEPRFAARRAALVAAGFAEAVVGDLAYLLVPLVVAYPQEWPSVEPAVIYAPKWLAALGLPLGSAAHHLLSDGRACLFGWGQWRTMTAAAVVQQRVVNHALSLLKIAAGMPPHAAFIGRVDHGGPGR